MSGICWVQGSLKKEPYSLNLANSYRSPDIVADVENGVKYLENYRDITTSSQVSVLHYLL